MLYTIIVGMCDVDLNGIRSLRGDRDVPTKGHRYEVMQEHCTNNYRKNFAQRVAPIWNSLPPSIVDFSSFVRFKRSWNNVNLGILLVFTARAMLALQALY